MGLYSLERFWVMLLLDGHQGRKWAGVPWLGEALESWPREKGEEGEKGRMVIAHSMFCLFPYQIKWKYDSATSLFL